VSLLSDTVRLFVQSASQCRCCPILYVCLSSQHHSVPAARYCSLFFQSASVSLLSDNVVCLSSQHHSVPVVRYCTCICPVSITVSLLSGTVRVFVQSASQCPCCPILYVCLSSQHHSVPAVRYCSLFVQSASVSLLSDTVVCLSSQHHSVPAVRYCTCVCPVSITVSLLSGTVRLFVQSASQCPCCPVLYVCLSSQHHSVPAVRYCTCVCPVSITVSLLSDTVPCLILMLCVCNWNTVQRNAAYWRTAAAKCVWSPVSTPVRPTVYYWLQHLTTVPLRFSQRCCCRLACDDVPTGKNYRSFEGSSAFTFKVKQSLSFLGLLDPRR